jgi:hypothetical protein
MLFAYMQKFNCKCCSYIYVLNYHIHKLYLLIACLPFYTFQKWWWMWRQPYNQWLNIQHSSSTYVFLNNSTSSSCFCLCSLLYASFSLAICYSFSIALCTLILLWTPKLQKRAQFPTINTNCFWQLPSFFHPWTSCPSHSFFHLPVIF